VKRFNKVIEDSLKRSHLLKIKLKVDPANCSSGEILKYNGYEGYILAENEHDYKVYIEDLGVVTTVPQEVIAIQDVLTPVEKFKICSLQYLISKSMINMNNDMLLRTIYTSPNLECIEAFLRESGLSDSDILSIYKNTLMFNI
jgi:hypothetical protein